MIYRFNLHKTHRIVRLTPTTETTGGGAAPITFDTSLSLDDILKLYNDPNTALEVKDQIAKYLQDNFSGLFNTQAAVANTGAATTTAGATGSTTTTTTKTAIDPLALTGGSSSGGSTTRSTTSSSNDAHGIGNLYDSISSSISAIKETKENGGDLKGARVASALSIIGAASDTISSFLPDKQEYSGKYGSMTKAADDVYDKIADKAPGWWGAMMKANKMVTGVLNNVGGGTDGKTWQDAMLGSSWFGPLGSINGFLGSSTSNIVKDDALFSLTGNSYTGTSNAVDEAIEKSGKYGALSSHQMVRAEKLIQKAQRLQDDLSDIMNLANTRNYLLQTMGNVIGNQRTLQMQGGLQQGALRAGKEGMKLPRMQQGNKIYNGRSMEELVKYALETNPEFILRLLESPEWFAVTNTREPGSHLLSYSTDKNNNTAYVYPNITIVDGEPVLLYGYKAQEHARNNNNFLEMTPEEAEMFTANYKEYFPEFMESFYKLTEPYLDEEGNVVGYKVGDIVHAGDLIRVKEEKQKDEKKEKKEEPQKKKYNTHTSSYASYLDFILPEAVESALEPIEEEELVPVYRKGGELYYNPLVCSVISAIEIEEEEPISGSGIIPIEEDPMFLRDGGEINIIPDGALHKELHHMEDPEGEWTRKGIPVVDAEGNLVAEIENSEIIVRKELIESMEEFTKKYYAKEATKEEKEQLALDAGITLVNEILYNTVDKTNKLL